MIHSNRIHLILALVVFLVGIHLTAASADEVLCYTDRVTDAASFNIYTGRNDANNPIIWSHSLPAGLLDRVVRVGLYIEAWDVDAPPVNDEHDRVLFNGYDLGLLEGFNNTWVTVEKTVPVEALREGLNELRVIVDELNKDWKVTIRASELRFYCRSAEPDFSIGLSPESLNVRQGEEAATTVALTALNGFDQAVQLSVSGLPASVGARFSANPLLPDPLGTCVLQLTVGSAVPVGEYALTVTGQSGGLQHERVLQLIVEAALIEPVYTMEITASPEQGRSPLMVRFMPRFSDETPPVATIYSWNFGDGNSTTGGSVSHVYNRPGLYAVILTAVLPGGRQLRAEKQIDVLGFSGLINLAFSKDEVLAGESLELQMFIHNPELTDIADLKLSLPLDQNLILDRVRTALQPAVTSPHPVWHIPLLRGGETLEITLEIHIDLRARPRTISQTAELSHAGYSPAIISAPARTQIMPLQLELTKTVDLNQSVAGGELIYGIRLRHPGFVDLKAVTISDALAEQLEFLSVQGPLNLQRQGNLLSWTGDVPAGSLLEWQVRVRVRPEAFSGDRIENRVRIRTDDGSVDLLSNTVNTTISGGSVSPGQLQLDHRAEIAQSEIGRVVRLRVTLSNRSASSIIFPRLSILLPSGFDYVPDSSLLNGALFGDPEGRGRISYMLDTLTAGQSLTLQYQLVIGASSRRGPNLCRAELRAIDGARNDVLRTADARVNVSASGLVFMSSLEGQVFLDRDKDGVYSPEDQSLAGIEVLLSNGERTISDELGRFGLNQLFPGEYSIGINRASLDKRYQVPLPGTRVVVLSDGLSDWVDLPLFLSDNEPETRDLSRLEARVFFDKNGNGVYDAGSDPLLKEFRAQLDEGVVTEGRNGRFVLTRQRPGSYTIRIESDGVRHSQELQLLPGSQTLDIPLRFSGIRITIQGEKK